LQILCLTRKIIPEELLHLKHCLSAVPISLSECEKGFLQMNLIVNPTESSLVMKKQIENCCLLKLSICSSETTKYMDLW
jgi:hypothetical protein